MFKCFFINFDNDDDDWFNNFSKFYDAPLNVYYPY